MKSGSPLSPIWFLKEPLDTEHKEYVLLDYLKFISKDLNQKNCLSTLKEISRLVRGLNQYQEQGSFSISQMKVMKKSETSFLKKFEESKTKEDLEMVDQIINKSLDTLYGYSEICLELLKKEESKIKILKIESKFGPKKPQENSGIVIIRNMVTDILNNYFFKSQVTMKTKDGEKEIVLFKKIKIKNNSYSLSYEYIYHEIIEELKAENLSFPAFYVIEIYEDFNEDSEIYRLAKERFIDYVSEPSKK
jgi:hypothetical protein